MSDQAGFVSLIVLILLLSLAAYGLEVFIKSQSELRISKREAERIQAVLLAEGGLDWAKGELAINSDWPGGERAIENGELKVWIQPEPKSSGFLVTSRAQVGLAKRTIWVKLERVNGIWRIRDYEVLH